MREKEPTHQMKIRFPTEMLDWLRQQAKDNRRSLNGEIVARVAKTKREEVTKAA